MKKTCGIAGLILLAATGSALASGYRIPEQSVNSVARAGGYVAYTPGADAAYYNPANMSWMENRAVVESDATWIHLTSIDYIDARDAANSGHSEPENFLMPTLFVVSPEYNNFRFGFSVTAPGGLSKEWLNTHPRTTAEEFTVKIFEFNPTVSYRFCDRFSVAAGIRGVYVDGRVKSNGQVGEIGGYPVMASRDMGGNTWEAGYNLAMSIRPVDKLNIGVTYRSKVELGVKGQANLSTNFPPIPGYPLTYNGDTGVEIPLPAVLAVAVSYTFFDQLTVELGYDRTYWSAYDRLDFTYPTALGNTVLTQAFDDPKRKSWSDTDAWRLSVTYDMKNDWTLMAGFAIDKNPAPDSTLGFELPDSDARLYSVGVRYKINQDMEIGAAYLYDDKESRRVNNTPYGGAIDGEIKNAAAHLLTVGFCCKF
ncbi:MAG: porin [Proteobacteria bacterium]|nr:porin [Pseudomonadota bacterium]